MAASIRVGEARRRAISPPRGDVAGRHTLDRVLRTRRTRRRTRRLDEAAGADSRRITAGAIRVPGSSGMVSHTVIPRPTCSRILPTTTAMKAVGTSTRVARVVASVGAGARTVDPAGHIRTAAASRRRRRRP